MPKCEKCGSDLQVKDGVLQCPNCVNTSKAPEEVDEAMELVEIPETSPSSESDRVKQLEARIAALEEEKSERDDQEKQQLERRVAELEAEKEKKEHRFDKLKALGNSKAMVFVKKHWLYLLAGALLFIVFLTLMITLVGLRGIYVNVNDPNDFYDFDATSYRASSIDFLTGKETLEEGKWKIKGDKLVLSIEDELFGKISADFDFENVDGFKRIKIDDVEYKRVSLVGLKTTQQKVKITFDPQNGQKPTVYKIKMGSTLDVDPPEVEQSERFPLLGWSDAQDGTGKGYVPGRRFWENVTYYGKWNDYIIEDGVLVAVNKARMKGDVTIPNGVTNIGYEAFEDCTGLTSVTISEGVTSIGRNAFFGCTGLQSVTIGEGVTSIGRDVFGHCEGLHTVNWNAINCTEAGDLVNSIFRKCNQLTTVNIGEKVQTIPDCAFYECTGLKEITIPDSVQSIGEGAFFNCNSIEVIKVKQGNPNYKSNGNCLIEKSTNALILGCKNSVIPNYVTNIGDDAFYGCTGITSVTIPDSVQSIGYWAFYGCTSLQTVTIGDGLQSIGDDAFYETPWYNALPNGVVYINKVLYEYKGEMPENTTINIKDGTVSISPGAFVFCSNLNSITIPESVTSIGDSAFSNCTGLTEITIPDSVTSIDDGAFSDCTGLSEITIPDSVTSIGERAFWSCKNLKDIYYAGNETQWAHIKKGEDWDKYIEYGYCTINYQLHYNSTGPRAASAEIEEEGAGRSASVAFEEESAPVVWVKKQRLCA